MMIGKAIRGWIGMERLVEELALERAAQREMVTQMMLTSERQAEALKSVTSIMESIYKAYQTDGSPPDGRHINEETEDKILEEIFYGPDESE